MIIAFTGKKYSGKSTACSMLSSKGYIEINFADPLKKVAAELSNIPLAYFYDPFKKEEPRDIEILSEVLLPTMFDRGVCKIPEELRSRNSFSFTSIRHLMQWLGSDLVREVDQDYWVNEFKRNINPNLDYVVGDVRFQNEAKAVRDLGGVVIELKRPGSQSSDNHISEQILIDADYRIPNTTIELLKRDVLTIEGLIKHGKKQKQVNR